MTLEPLISIITPNYNGKSFLEETYRSILNQTYKNWEWIVIDDNSKDGSQEYLKRLYLENDKVKTILFQQNMGAATARNCGIEASTGEYIAFLDADDIWEPIKLQLFIEQMVKNKWDMCYGNYIKMNRTGEVGKEVIETPERISFKDLLKTCSICTSTAILKRSIVGTLRMKPELRRGQDYVFWLELLKNNSLVAHRVSEKPLTRYRVGVSNSLSSNKLKKAIGQWQIYRDHLKIGFLKSILYFISYAYWGFKKHKQF